jgi:hypothetical protein
MHDSMKKTIISFTIKDYPVAKKSQLKKKAVTEAERYFTPHLTRSVEVFTIAPSV